ncbi:MAG: S-layer homology domain-containing protein [Thermoleophilia bacterium]
MTRGPWPATTRPEARPSAPTNLTCGPSSPRSWWRLSVCPWRRVWRRLSGISVPTTPGSLYPHDYIAAAYRAGLIKGYPGGAFRPWGPVGRAQLVTLVVRAASALGPSLLLTPPAWYDSLFGDFDLTHGASMGSAQYNGLLNGVVGYGRTWSPWLPATRGEGAQVLWNLLRIDLGPGHLAGNGVSVTGVDPLWRH